MGKFSILFPLFTIPFPEDYHPLTEGGMTNVQLSFLAYLGSFSVNPARLGGSILQKSVNFFLKYGKIHKLPNRCVSNYRIKHPQITELRKNICLYQKTYKPESPPLLRNAHYLQMVE